MESGDWLALLCCCSMAPIMLVISLVFYRLSSPYEVWDADKFQERIDKYIDELDEE